MTCKRGNLARCRRQVQKLAPHSDPEMVLNATHSLRRGALLLALLRFYAVFPVIGYYSQLATREISSELILRGEAVCEPCQVSQHHQPLRILESEWRSRKKVIGRSKPKMAQHSTIMRHYAGECIRPTHITSGPRPVEFEQPRSMSGQPRKEG